MVQPRHYLLQCRNMFHHGMIYKKNRKKKFLIVCSHEPSVTISHFLDTFTLFCANAHRTWLKTYGRAKNDCQHVRDNFQLHLELNLVSL